MSRVNKISLDALHIRIISLMILILLNQEEVRITLTFFIAFFYLNRLSDQARGIFSPSLSLPLVVRVMSSSLAMVAASSPNDS